MNRILFALILILVVLVSAAAMMIYLAYGIDASPPDTVEDAPVSSQTIIEWHADYTRISASDEASLYTALGFVHGLHRTWTINLWRQVAFGHTAAWYGEQTRGIDSLALQLGIAGTARSTFRMLPEEDRRLLQAYSDGINLALSRRSTRLAEEFTMLGITPEQWEPWHVLAVENLFAWLAATPLPALGSDDLQTAAAETLRRSELIRELLAVHDIHHSSAFTTSGPDGIIGARYVYGSSTEPLFEEHELILDGDRRVAVVLPGTPFPFVTAEPERLFMLLPSTASSIATTIGDTTEIPFARERAKDRWGQEHVLTFNRNDGTLLLHEDEVQLDLDTMLTAGRYDSLGVGADTVLTPPVVTRRWTLEWNGIESPSDASAFIAALRGDRADFSLFRGGWLRVVQGNIDVGGDPDRIARQDGSVAVGSSDWVEPIVARIAILQSHSDSLGTEALMSDVQSVWAEGLIESMISSAASIPDPSPGVAEALSYLRNWNYQYDGANIAASIFDEWIRLYRDSLGTSPTESVVDSLFTERYLRYHFLANAIDTLSSRYGSDMSQWRWERVRRDRRYVAGFPPHGTLEFTPNRRYDVIDLPGRGHPSTIYYGTTALEGSPPGSATWEVWASRNALDSLSIRRRHIDVSSFRGRYIESRRTLPTVQFATDDPVIHTTTLRPAE